MASPPFLVEDQTDEDFFDKLVDDEFVISESGPSIADGADSDEAKAFSNLRIGEVSTVSEDSIGEDGCAMGGEKPSQDVNRPSLSVPEKENQAVEETAALTASSSFSFEHRIESSRDITESDVASELKTSNGGGSKNTGIKEVQWTSFYSDLAQNAVISSRTYSDIFTGFDDSSEDPFASVGDEVKVDSSIFAEKVVGDSNISNNCSQNTDGQVPFASNEHTAGDQDLQNNQYWENMYPGWWYDQNTGEWCQMEGTEATGNYHENFGVENQMDGNNFAVNQKSEVSYLQQTVQSFAGTVAEDCTTGSVSTWNQASQEISEYPAYMVFDPQYPGWYYDTIVQEWRALETYAAANQSTTVVYDQQTAANQSTGVAYDQQTAANQSTSMDYDPQTKSESNSNGSFFRDKEHNLYNDGQVGNYGSWSMTGEGEGQGVNWAYASSNHRQQNMNMWRPETVAKSESLTSFTENQQSESVYSSRAHVNAMPDKQTGFKPMENTALYEQKNNSYSSNSHVATFQNFVPVDNLSQHLNHPKLEQSQQIPFSQDYYGNQKSGSHALASFHAGTQLSYNSNEGRSSAGRPPHALVTFGFGGKLIVMKDSNSINSVYGNQDGTGGSISVLDLMDVVAGKSGAVIAFDSTDYFSSLCLQSFPGPLVGGSVGNKEVNKWIDERITNCELSSIDVKRGELLRLLLSLLKISCQHYGKIRSLFGTDPSQKESDRPESALAKLFASSKKNGAHMSGYGGINDCLYNVPSEGQMQEAAAEVEKLLVSGRTKEALCCAQEGQLWGLALTLAAKLGNQYYVDTVKLMALHQFKRGSPLRTLCLLIAGQPAEVFSVDNTVGSGLPGAAAMSMQPTQFGANMMLDNWEENLSIITANRTEGDELVILHLGDCLWKERSEITAAHICYLVAEANFESFSDTARLCLIGADHWKLPRTYASPDAIQRTELYEYSKVLGNSQSILLPFQPYKLIYAHMLAEVGKLSDSLKYCQAILKSLKTGRIPEVDAWKQSVSLLEDRIKTHQQGGFSTNLAAGKLVGKLLPFIDRSIHRMIGPPPPPPPASSAQGLEQDIPPVVSRVGNSQPAMGTQFLMPSSASMEPISEWKGVNNRMTMPNRSISEPDFGRSPIQDQVNPSNEAASSDAHTKSLGSGGGSRFGRFGSSLLQKTMGWVSRSRPDRQAKLGEKNKFYYDEKLKRWVEEGAELPAEETALPPPPTTASFQNGNIRDESKPESLPANNGWPEIKSPVTLEHSSGGGMPPIPPSSNQFSARARMGVRSRYVDTFNKGGGTPTNLFQSPSVPAVKPGLGGGAGANAKFFIPTPVPAPASASAISGEDSIDATMQSKQEPVSIDDGPSTSMSSDTFFSSPLPPPPPHSSSSSSSMQRFPSMNNIAPSSTNGIDGSFSSRSRRTVSWSGGSVGSFSPKANETKPKSEAQGMMPPSSFMPNHYQAMSSPIMNNGGGFGDDLHEVEL